MKNLERFLAEKLLTGYNKFKILDAKFVEDEEDHWLVVWVDFKGESKSYKKRSSQIVWEDALFQWETYVATELFRDGYLISPMDNGWIVVNDLGDEYQINEDNECSCKDFRTGRCKHLVLRDWVLKTRTRALERLHKKGYLD